MIPPECKIEQMFCDISGLKTLDRHQLIYARRLVKRAHRYGGAVFIFMPLRIWRVFHKRHRLVMLASSRPKVRALAIQLDAEQDAASAGAAIDAALNPRTDPSAPPGSADDR